MLVPEIDISAFLDSTCSSSERDVVAKLVAKACREVGFLVITNHGIPSETIETAFAAAKEYFDMSEDEKKKIPMTPTYPYGYEMGEILSKSRDPSNQQEPQKDAKETFQICLGPVGKSPKLEPQWPALPTSFRPAMATYYRAVESLASVMMQIFATALDLSPDFFNDKIDEHMSALRILNYPHQDHVAGMEQLRASPHTDYGSLTILAVDDAPGGLQVMDQGGQWQDVKPPVNSFVVNLGDLMQRWTNDVWRSTLHRVVNPPEAAMKTGASNRRQSIAFFHNINHDAVVECIPSCQSKDNPPKYTPILAGEHLMMKHSAAQGYK